MRNKIALLLLLTATCYAGEDQYILDVGVGDFDSAKGNMPDTKMVGIGVEEELWGALKDRGVVGGWADTGGGGRSGSAFAAMQLGWEVQSGGTVISVFSGPGVISSPDVVLGGAFQFITDLHLGIKDRDGNYLGAFFRHISSAGIETPNLGRDIVGLEIAL